MASHEIDVEFLKTIPTCPDHGSPCFIKTGTRQSPNFGKSFFICSSSNMRCSFAQLAMNVPATTCPLHSAMVELKAFALKPGGFRCYYRCALGKEEGSSWCGQEIVKSKLTYPHALKDISNSKGRPDVIKKTSPSTSSENICSGNPIRKDDDAPRVSEANPLHNTCKISGPVTCADSCFTSISASASNATTTGAFLPETSGATEAPSTRECFADSAKTQRNPTSELNNFAIVIEDELPEEAFHTSKDVAGGSLLEYEVSKEDPSDETKTAVNNALRPDIRSWPLTGGAVKKHQQFDAFQILDSDDDEDDHNNLDASGRSSDDDSHEIGGREDRSIIDLDSTFHNMSVTDSGDSEIAAPVVMESKNASVSSLAGGARPESVRQDLLCQLRKKQALFDQVSKHTPDGGLKIRLQINALRRQLDEMDSKKPAEAAAPKVGAAPQMKTLPYPPVRSAAVAMSSASSLHGMKFTEPLPPSNRPSSFLYCSNPQQLFGGRMTAGRLEEVGRITKGAIEELHLSLDSCPPPTEEADDPEGLSVRLMKHQRQALCWLLWREQHVPSGGILADDMGLGKTLTMISLILKSKQLEKRSGTTAQSKLVASSGTLVICPASLVHQWNKEVDSKVKKMGLTVCLYHGTNRESNVNRVARHDVVLTTYNIVSLEGKVFVDKEKDTKVAPATQWLGKDVGATESECGLLFKIRWRRVILDEGHQIKNHKTATAISISKLEAESRWVVTGTPIQNETMDLYALVKFLHVAPFDELKVWKREVDNKSSLGRKRMNTIVSSLLLRRTKDQIDKSTGKPLVVLPKRTCQTHELKLSPDESAVYALVYNFSRNTFAQFLDSRKDTTEQHASASHRQYATHPVTKPPDADVPSIVLGLPKEGMLSLLGMGGINAKHSGCILVLVLRLRQCCGHLSLMCEPIDEELRQADGIELPVDEQLGNLSLDEAHHSPKITRPRQLTPSYESTKVKAVLDCLRDLRSQGRADKPVKSVIVSQWTRMLDIFAYHLQKAGFPFDSITGSVNAKKRSDIVDRFNRERNPEVLLVSLKAGGVGLNLVGGSHLFLIDQHWNPALEEQACDRVYRVGQQNDVVIHKFLCSSTVEERILSLQEKKRVLAENVLCGGKTNGQQKLTLADLKMIFGIS